ncbi:MAG: hypothetical protein GOV00_03695 [Candidatus Altiarchaeota archaeon]|nr:hypothetical protein [Candidatus Altiarchaeota archaeon]
MEILSAIKNTRLVENFSGKDLPMKVVLEIIDTARWAISFQDMQSWELIMIKDEDRKKELSEIVLKGELKKASVLMVICSNVDRARFAAGEKGAELSTIEVSAFIQNIVTASRHFGVSCNVLADFSKEKLRAFIESPEGVVPLAVVSLGFTTHYPNVKRVPITTFIHTEKFGTPWQGELPSKFSERGNKSTFMHIFG